jgi:hypothetical protein
MHERYIEVCDQILYYKDHRDPLVRRAVIELIPTLASYNHTDFAPNYLHKTMRFLLSQLKKDRDRTTGTSLFFSRGVSSRASLTVWSEQLSMLSGTSRCMSRQGWRRISTAF